MRSMSLFRGQSDKVDIKSYLLSVLGGVVIFAGMVLLILAFIQRFVQAKDENGIREIAEGPRFVVSGDFVQNETEEPQTPMQYVEKKHKDRSEFTEAVKTAAGIVSVKWADPTERKIDFDALWEVNPDIKAWIYIPNTRIDYPVMVATSDEGEDFYLKRNYNKRSSAHGSIFIQTGCDEDFSDYDTILYGHNMKDGSMFQDVYELRDVTSTAARNMLYIYTPEKTIKARLVSCYETDNSLLTETFNDFKENEDRERYVKTFQNTTETYNLYKDRLPDNETRLITLSTCVNEGKGRLLAQYLVI